MTRSLATRIKGQLLLVLFGISVGIGPLAPEGSTEAGMVDTVQYGQIQLGMKESEVRERLGKPDRIQESERRIYRKGTQRVAKRKRLIYEGVNPASGQKIVTVILIENGKVVDKKRSYR
jgi:(2Fe-2S) ferredoxin